MVNDMLADMCRLIVKTIALIPPEHHDEQEAAHGEVRFGTQCKGGDEKNSNPKSSAQVKYQPENHHVDAFLCI